MVIFVRQSLAPSIVVAFYQCCDTFCYLMLIFKAMFSGVKYSCYAPQVTTFCETNYADFAFAVKPNSRFDNSQQDLGLEKHTGGQTRKPVMQEQNLGVKTPIFCFCGRGSDLPFTSLYRPYHRRWWWLRRATLIRRRGASADIRKALNIDRLLSLIFERWRLEKLHEKFEVLKTYKIQYKVQIAPQWPA